MLRRIAFTAANVLALAATANAADFGGPSYAVVNWSGFYAGVNAGYGWDASSIGSKIDDGLFKYDIQPGGGFGGGQIGYNMQNGNIVYGIEADIQGAGIENSVKKSGSVVVNDPLLGTYAVSATGTAKSTLDYFGTVRARLGYTTGPALIYVTGGLAYGEITDEFTGTATVSAFGLTASGTARTSKTVTPTGWVIGGGAEQKLFSNLGVKAEYQYIDLGQDSPWAKLAKEDYAIHTFRVGVNYYFGAANVPLK